MPFKTLSHLYGHAVDYIIAGCVAPFSQGLTSQSPTLTQVMTQYVKAMQGLHVPPALNHFERIVGGIFNALPLQDRLTLLRQEVTGRDLVDIHGIPTAKFGPKLTMYADFTASGKALKFVQTFLEYISEFHANPHSGKAVYHAKVATEAYHDGVDAVLKTYGVDHHTHTCLMPTAGSSGALKFLQDLLGVTVPHPQVMATFKECTGQDYISYLRSNGKLSTVFTTSWEHHSNSLPWESGLCHREQIGLTSDGLFDLDDFEVKMHEELKKENIAAPLILSFSIASNVSGVMLPRDQVEKRVEAFREQYPSRKIVLIYDAAGGGPYIPMNLQSGIVDAVVESPHKMIGGNGTSGTVVFKNQLYDHFTQTPHQQLVEPQERAMPVRRQGGMRDSFSLTQRSSRPSVGGPGGGTVFFTAPTKFSRGMAPQVMASDRAERETKGTPACTTAQKTGLAFLTRQLLGMSEVFAHEMHDVEEMLSFFQSAELQDRIWVVQKPLSVHGQAETLEASRIPIFSFNILVEPRLLPPGFPGKMIYSPNLVAALMNDLFGIQSRGGCSCAGEYGHEQFSVTEQQSESMRYWTSPLENLLGEESHPSMSFIKPGWERVNTHFTHSEGEKTYLKRAIAFLAQHIHAFLPLYEVDPVSGEWALRADAHIPVKASLPKQGAEELFEVYQARVFQAQLVYAETLVGTLSYCAPAKLEIMPELADIQVIALCRENLSVNSRQLIQEKNAARGAFV